MMLPGAGLKEVDSDHIFDSIFGSKKERSDSSTQQESIDVEMCYEVSQGPTHRTYSSNEAMLVFTVHANLTAANSCGRCS